MRPESLHKQLLTNVEIAIDKALADNNNLTILIDAMRYSSLNGGKRIRPLLTIAVGLIFEANLDSLVKVSTAVEFIHCYSLIHDDLPAMDNDDLRRGQATCHVKYNEATAILAGDALQSLAFELLSNDALDLTSNTKLKIINLLAKSSGVEGMAGGQALDLLNTGKIITQVQLQQMHNMKTGALIKCAVLSGYLASNQFSESTYNKLEDFAIKLGLLFQIIDDIIDVTSDTSNLGKTAHKDTTNHKATYVTILGLENSQKYAKTLYLEIKSILEQIQTTWKQQSKLYTCGTSVICQQTGYVHMNGYTIEKNLNAEFLLYLVDLVYNRNK